MALVRGAAVVQFDVREGDDVEPGADPAELGRVVQIQRSRVEDILLREPILFLGYRDLATLGERWRFRP
jgi:hypothetical protein